MHRLFLLLLTAAIFSECSFSSGLAAEPYGLRNFRLGMTAGAFRAVPFPDQSIWPGAKALCSDDPELPAQGVTADDSIHVSDAEAKAGIVRCAFFYWSGASISPAGLVVADTRAAASFVFVPDAAGALRLAWIKVTASSDNYGQIRAALIQKYGRPRSHFMGYATNATGTVLEDETTRWSNEVSDIRLDQRDETVNSMVLEYIHEQLVSDGLKRLQAILGSPTNTL